MPFTETGNWYSQTTDAPAAERPALILDRDGVVVQERHFLSDPDAVELIDGAAHVIRRFREAGYAIVLVTNQSGIGRGLFDWDEFLAVQTRIDALLSSEGARFDMALACPFHPTEAIGGFLRDDPWRKPNPGMIRFAAETLALDLENSVLVGDRLTDIEAGAKAGVDHLVHVATGHGKAERGRVTASPLSERVELQPSLAAVKQRGARR